MGPREIELRRRLARDPRDGATRAALISLVRRQGRSSEVAWLLHMGISQDPGNTELLRQMGDTLFEAGAMHEAIRYYEAAMRAPEVDGRAVTRLAMGYRAIGKRKASRELLLSAREGRNLPPRGQALKAIESHLGGDTAAATAMAEQALERSRGDVVIRCVVDSLLAAMRRGDGPALPRVALYLDQPFHYPVLKPVFDALVPHIDVVLTGDAAWIVEQDPRVVVAAGAEVGALRPSVPKASFVFARQDPIGRGISIATARDYDFVCASSEEMRDQYVHAGGLAAERVWVTGSPPMDPLFKPDPLPLPFPVPEDRPVVLWAPASEPGLSGVEMLKADFADRIVGPGEDVTLVVKPHPLTALRNPRWMRWFKEAAARRSNVHVDENPSSSVMSFLRRADLLVSDASSVVFQYLALDRPVVLLDNPRRFEDPAFEPEAVEWRWREVAERVEDPGQLAAVVRRGLAQPAARSPERRRRAASLFGSLRDGRASERIARHIRELMLRP